MNVLILGGGAQGKACLFDLCQNKDLKSIKIVENNVSQIDDFVKSLKDSRVEVLPVNANDVSYMFKLFKESDIVIDLLPTVFRKKMTDLAIKTRVNIVNTSFQSNIKQFEEKALKAGIIMMPSAGLDPGIDLVLAGNAVSRFDLIESLESACGGIPTKEACDNPLNYKISWNFEGVLSAYKRPASLIMNGERVGIKGDEIFNYGEEIDIKGVGRLEGYPNGFSTTYAKLLGIDGDVKKVGRYTLRWPGHCEFWKRIVDMGLLEEDTVMDISPKKYLAEILAPRLQYKDNERDLVVLRNEIIGIKNGKRVRVTQQIVDRKDLKTGLMAMNRTVGFTAAIVAQMILNKEIIGVGMLNPAKDIPFEKFIEELRKRKIEVTETEEEL